MDLIDSKYVDVKLVSGKVVVEFPVIAVLRELAKSSSNTLDDALVDLVAKALEPSAA